MFHNTKTKFFRLIIMFVFTTFIINCFYYTCNDMFNKLLSISLITAIFMAIDIYCPYVIIDSNNILNGLKY